MRPAQSSFPAESEPPASSSSSSGAGEQVGGGFGVNLAKNVVKGAAKAQKVATGLGAAVLTSKAGFKPMSDILANADKIATGAKAVNKARKAAKASAKASSKTSKASKSGHTGSVIRGQKAIEGPKDLVPMVSTAAKVGKAAKSGKSAGTSTKEMLNAAARLGIKAGEKLKNKKLGDIIEGAATTSKALKGAAKELGKRGGKAAVAAAITGGFTAGAATATNYLVHMAKGGEPMNKKEIGMMAVDTGLRLAMQGLDGKLTRKVAAEEVIRSYNDIIKNKQGGRPIPKSINVSQTLGNLGKLLSKLNKIHMRRHYEVNGEAPLALETRRPFGSGMAGEQQSFGGGGRRRRGARKHRCKRRRKGGRRRKCSHGVKRLHNIFTSSY